MRIIKLMMSKQACEVVAHLNELGIDIVVNERSAFDLEVCCSQFFPNHIIGVIDECLKGKKPIHRLLRAQHMGWRYFAGPVRNFLKGRVSAHQPKRPDLVAILPWASKCWSIATTSFLVHDMNRDEADILLAQIPHLCDTSSLILAMGACRDRDARSVHYLRGVLQREQARKVASVQERDRTEVGPWEPGEFEAMEERLGISDWDNKRAGVDSVRAMKRGKA